MNWKNNIEYILVKNSKNIESIRKFLLGNLARVSSLNLFSKKGTLFTSYTGILLREGVRYNDYDDAPAQEFEMFPENPQSVMYIGLRFMDGTDEPVDYYFVPYTEFLNDLQEVKKIILEDALQAGPSVDEDLERIKVLMKRSERPYDPNDYIQDNKNTLENDEPWTLEQPEE